MTGIKGAADTITVKSGGISSIPPQYVPKEPEEFRQRVTEFAKSKEYYTKFYNIIKKFYQELAGNLHDLKRVSTQVALTFLIVALQRLLKQSMS